MRIALQRAGASAGALAHRCVRYQHTAGIPQATVVRCGMVRTQAAHRPAPSLMIYPGLTQKPVWDAAAFPWLRQVVQAVPEMQAEYAAAAAAAPTGDYSVKTDEHTLHAGGSWLWHSFVSKGKLNPSFAQQCPTTAAVLQSIPDLLTGIPFAYAFFSTLKPGTTIAPHFGPSNVRLRMHVPLQVPVVDPTTLAITIAGTPHSWRMDQPLVFDDTYEHGVHYTAGSGHRDRVLLLFDIWHPELSPAERTAVQGMFDGARQKGWIS